MTDTSWFTADIDADFEESIRIDRKGNEQDHRLEAIDSYYMTEEAEDFARDFFSRLLGRSEDMRSGANYWLYGYYGSGKSHLLSVLDGLLNSEWLTRQNDIWGRLSNEQDLSELSQSWEAVHEEYEIIPISINLLKYQGQRKWSFSELILRAAHSSDPLTGVKGGFSPQLDVAFFEDWYRTTDTWEERDERTQSALQGIVTDPTTYSWEDVQEYNALADVVLPELFEEETGSADGLADLAPSDLDPATMITRLENLRKQREAESDRSVKLVLLLDEVSLFIGTDFDRLTELQTLAESVDDIGEGDIQMVATAQAKIEDVQPQFAARGADFTIVKARFPHRFGLPSRHVGEISTQRLLKKTPRGRQEIEDILTRTSNDPETLLVYSGINQNTNPPLDNITRDQLFEFYPFLPYQPALFLEILSNLRQKASDPAKSIFSGTARAILALVHGLLQKWHKAGSEAHVISLVDFYDLIDPELEEITSEDVEVIEEIEAKRDAGELQAIDLDVAKAVLLLQHVPETIPMTERNLAVAVLTDLDGPTQFQMENRVEESLQRLRKYIRPTHEEAGARYTFANQEEREIYERAESNLGNPEWDAILEAVDQHLWPDIVRELALPSSAEYGDTGEQYLVEYSFEVDGVAFETTVDAEDALDVDIAIEGISPAGRTNDLDGEPLKWSIGGDGLSDLRETLVDWWSLQTAVGDHSLPQSVERDLSGRASRARSKLVGVLKGGAFEIKDRTDIRGLTSAVEESIQVRYPDDFHPVMLQIGEEHLRELRQLTAKESLPRWAEQIEVATEDPETHGGSIQNNVRAVTGQQLKQRGGNLAMTTILDSIVDRKPIYEASRPALCAVIWGLCRKGDFLPVDETGTSLELDAVIDLSRLSTTRLKIAGGSGIRAALEAGGFLESTETVPDGIVHLQEANETHARRLRSLSEDVELVAQSDIESRPIQQLLEAFIETLEARIEETTARQEAVKSGDTNWKETVDATNDAREWYEEATEIWELRLPVLAQVDAQLTLCEQSFEWVTDDCKETSRTLRERINEYDGGWWTHDSWDRFNDVTAVTPTLGTVIEAAWDRFQQSTEIPALISDLHAHLWVRPASEFQSNVRPAFETTYLTPLRRTVSWYEDTASAVETITGGTTNTEMDDFVRASGTIISTSPLSVTVGHSVVEIRSTYEELQAIVGDRDPSDVAAIGVLPPDRDSLDREIEKLTERADLNIEQVENGVIIR